MVHYTHIIDLEFYNSWLIILTIRSLIGRYREARMIVHWSPDTEFNGQFVSRGQWIQVKKDELAE